MNSPHFNWKRFWYPRGSSLNLADGGYLPDPDSKQGKIWNPQIVSFDDISDVKGIVLLGDPGMGKSMAFLEQKSTCDKRQQDTSDKYLFINLRSYQTDTQLAANLFESPIFKEWLGGTHSLHLFLDSLDEGLLSIKILSASLVDEFKKLPCERLYLRIACRTVEWPNLLEHGLIECLGEENVEHYVLAPLRKKDVEEAARVSDLDAKRFTDQVESSGVIPFAIKPVTLKFLLSLSRKQGSLPSSQNELYLQGCRELVSEKSESRVAAQETGRLSAEHRLAVATRIAAGMIFGNRNTVYFGMDLYEASDEDLKIPELSGGFETANGIRFNVGEKEVRETLTTGLFSTRGSNHVGWGHQTYAEFLAAYYLKEHDVLTPQIKSLITHPDDLNRKIIPQLGETAVWLGGMIPEVFQDIVGTEPDLMLRSDVATGDSERRATLVAALLRLYDKEHIFDRNREHYKNLAHPDLADQLRPYISDKTKGIIVRRVAIDIAESCNIQNLNDALLKVALDTSDNLQIRIQAGYAISIIGDRQTREKLKPLAFSDDDADTDDELKGSILRTLWPSHITARELFSLLQLPKRDGFSGLYRFFLHSELLKGLAPQDLVPALEFITSLSQPRHEMDSALETLMDGIGRMAWGNMEIPGVKEAFATFVASRLKHHEELIKGQSGEPDNHIFMHDENKRRRLLEAVFAVVENQIESEVDWLSFGYPSIVLAKDFEWLISCLDRLPGKPIQNAIGYLVQLIFNSSDPRQFELLYEACNRHPIIAEIFRWALEPIPLDSEQAKKLKVQHKRIEEFTRKREASNLEPPPADRVAAALEQCETQDSVRWWLLHRELSLDASVTHYDRRFEWDVMKLPGWVSADQTTRERIILAVERFIQTQVPNSADWLGTGHFNYLVLSGYSALALLLKTRPAVLDSLTADQFGRWCPIILAFPFFDDDKDRLVKAELLQFAYRKSPSAVLDVAKVLIEKEMEKGETIWTATELNAIWDEQVANLLLRFAKSTATSPKSMGSLLSVLFAHDNVEARTFSESLLPLPPPKTGPEGERAIIAAQTLILNTPNAGWTRVWPAIQLDEDFGKEVILGVSNDYSSIGPRLNEEQLADLYVWLTRHFEPPKHRSGEAHWVSPLDNVDMWRNTIIQLLIHRGNFQACDAIKKLQQEFPESDWLKSVHVDAEAEARRATWVPTQPQDIVKLAADCKVRLVQSGDQLLEVLVESLERLQIMLQGEVPESQFLWDNVSKSDANPKDENALADYVKIYLDKDLKDRGIVINREVRIHRGQRTDIHVNAITQSAPGDSYDSIAVIIECKGCWNRELYDAMRKQLVEQYIKNNPCQHGLYLVGWFNCENWSKDDYKKKDAERLCPTIDETKQRLTALAADLSKASLRIKSVVIDTSLH